MTLPCSPKVQRKSLSVEGASGVDVLECHWVTGGNTQIASPSGVTAVARFLHIRCSHPSLDDALPFFPHNLCSF